MLIENIELMEKSHFFFFFLNQYLQPFLRCRLSKNEKIKNEFSFNIKKKFQENWNKIKYKHFVFHSKIAKKVSYPVQKSFKKKKDQF